MSSNVTSLYSSTTRETMLNLHLKAVAELTRFKLTDMLVAIQLRLNTKTNQQLDDLDFEICIFKENKRPGNCSIIFYSFHSIRENDEKLNKTLKLISKNDFNGLYALSREV